MNAFNKFLKPISLLNRQEPTWKVHKQLQVRRGNAIEQIRRDYHHFIWQADD